MRAYFLIPCAALALAACDNNQADDAAVNADANAMMVDNMATDANMMAPPGGADANMATNTTEEMNTDLNTNDADTNLANGM